MPRGVCDKFFLNPHFVIRDAGTLRWFAGLPTAVCGWTLEAIKPDRGDPPVQNGAGFDGAYTAAAGHFLSFRELHKIFISFSTSTETEKTCILFPFPVKYSCKLNYCLVAAT